MKQVVLKQSPHGLWIFKDMIKRQENKFKPGSEIMVKYKNKIIGAGFYNPDSLIRLRLYSFKKESFTKKLIQSRISDAFRFRKQFDFGDSYRLLFGESDYLPGLIVDRYKNCFVIQTLCLGMAKRIPLVVEVLKKIFSPTLIYQKDNSPLRKLEGMGSKERVIWGKIPADIWIEQDGLKLNVDIRHGQKTGFYLDQRVNRKRVQKLAKDKKVLDLFTYSGSFALYAAKGGASNVTGVDQSKVGIKLARKSAQANALKCTFKRAEIFTFLRKHKRKYDLINIDPPSFTRKKAERDRAMRGYFKLLRMAIKCLNPYGIIILSTCSHYITVHDLMSVVSQASIKTRKRFRTFAIGSQAPDHPILPSMPETEYLKCLYLQSF